MKLNYDCMRAVLLKLENELTIYEDLCPNFIQSPELLENSDLSGYTKQDVIYSLKMLFESGMLDGEDGSNSSGLHFVVYGITFQGHEFLEKIKSEKEWSKTKSILQKLGSISVSIISDVATCVISDSIKKTIGL